MYVELSYYFLLFIKLLLSVKPQDNCYFLSISEIISEIHFEYMYVAVTLLTVNTIYGFNVYMLYDKTDIRLIS